MPFDLDSVGEDLEGEEAFVGDRKPHSALFRAQRLARPRTKGPQLQAVRHVAPLPAYPAV